MQRERIINHLKATGDVWEPSADIAAACEFELSSASGVLSTLVRESAVHHGPGVYSARTRDSARRREYGWFVDMSDAQEAARAHAVDLIESYKKRAKPKKKAAAKKPEETPPVHLVPGIDLPLVTFDVRNDHVRISLQDAIRLMEAMSS